MTRNSTGTIMDVEHVVILMQENRSFDHYFGTMQGVRGFGDRFPIPVPAPGADAPRTVWLQRNAQGSDGPALVSPFHLDTRRSFAAMRVTGTPHTWPDGQGAWNNGIIDQWPTFKQNHAMGYFTEADIPFQFALANAFTICDAYHCSVQAGTNPNRVYAWTGTIDPAGAGRGPVIGNSYDQLGYDPQGGYLWTTYPERLQAAGISWQVYQDMRDNYTDNPLVGFRRFRDAAAGLPGAHEGLRERALVTRDIAQLKRDVQDGRLPQVSYIVATAEGSEHPVPSSPAQGAEYTASVLDALASNPAVWRKTVLLLMFDENDGFFDHVPPPAPPSNGQGASTVSTAGEYHEVPSLDAPESAQYLHRPYGLGPRVPMYVISPWSRGGWVNSQVFDHTSVIRFIEQRFGVMEPNITPWRRAVCGDLTSAFDFGHPDASPFFEALPATAERARRARQLERTVMPPAPAQPSPPLQTPGTRPSRALPYALHVCERFSAETMALALWFANTGQAGAVFHVYDRLRLAAGPRRYTVEPDKELGDSWPLADSAGAYDLWVLGPNGFHRHFAGNANESLLRGVPDAVNGNLVVKLRNPGSGEVTFVLTENGGAEDKAVEIGVAPGASAEHGWNLAHCGHWYDFSARVKELPGFVRRCAGRVETGRDGISEPVLTSSGAPAGPGRPAPPMPGSGQ